MLPTSSVWFIRAAITALTTNCGGALTQTQILFVHSLVRGPLDVLKPTVFLFVHHVLILRLVRITENITHEYYYVGGGVRGLDVKSLLESYTVHDYRL